MIVRDELESVNKATIECSVYPYSVLLMRYSKEFEKVCFHTWFESWHIPGTDMKNAMMVSSVRWWWGQLSSYWVFVQEVKDEKFKTVAIRKKRKDFVLYCIYSNKYNKCSGLDELKWYERNKSKGIFWVLAWVSLMVLTVMKEIKTEELCLDWGIYVMEMLSWYLQARIWCSQGKHHDETNEATAVTPVSFFWVPRFQSHFCCHSFSC